jgi:hypothetical protein
MSRGELKPGEPRIANPASAAHDRCPAYTNPPSDQTRRMKCMIIETELQMLHCPPVVERRE